jgi:hypothetical protein
LILSLEMISDDSHFIPISFRFIVSYVKHDHLSVIESHQKYVAACVREQKDHRLREKGREEKSATMGVCANILYLSGKS